jgi:hypothetical protein
VARGYWDTHGNNFGTLRQLLPVLDRGIFALVSDLHQRGLDQDIASESRSTDDLLPSSPTEVT